jgi:hypothetical protein
VINLSLFVLLYFPARDDFKIKVDLQEKELLEVHQKVLFLLFIKMFDNVDMTIYFSLIE